MAGALCTQLLSAQPGAAEAVWLDRLRALALSADRVDHDGDAWGLRPALPAAVLADCLDKGACVLMAHDAGRLGQLPAGSTGSAAADLLLRREQPAVLSPARHDAALAQPEVPDFEHLPVR